MGGGGNTEDPIEESPVSDSVVVVSGATAAVTVSTLWEEVFLFLVEYIKSNWFVLLQTECYGDTVTKQNHTYWASEVR